MNLPFYRRPTKRRFLPKARENAKTTRSVRRHLLLGSALVLFLGTLPTQAKRRTEGHILTSTILAEAHISDNRNLLVDLPDGYDTSGLHYPVIYLIHGARGAPNDMTGAAVDAAVDKLIADNPILSVILVRPNMSRSPPRSVPFEQYLAREVVPFIDATYRTIPTRHGRAVAGYSLGGADAVFTALSHPELFSMAGAYAMGNFRTGMSNLIRAHKQHRFPLQFWFYWGRNDDVVPSPRSTLR